jgi:hypothetical protein
MTEDIFVPVGIEPSREQLAIELARVLFGLVKANAGVALTTTRGLRIVRLCCVNSTKKRQSYANPLNRAQTKR